MLKKDMVVGVLCRIYAIISLSAGVAGVSSTCRASVILRVVSGPFFQWSNNPPALKVAHGH